MKKLISISSLKKLIKEALEAPASEIAQVISSMSADDLAAKDYVDSETGEVVLGKGEKARTSSLHPQHKIDRKEAQSQRHARYLKDEEDWAKEDEEWELTKQKVKNDADAEYTAAVREFAANWTEFKQEHESDEDLESNASDAANGFFHDYPEWKHWAAQLRLSKNDIKSAVSEFVYEAMMTGKVP